LGHLSRSGAAALALNQLGRSTRCIALGAPASLERDGVEWEPADDVPAWEGVMLLDSYRLDPEQVAGEGVLLAVIHDRAAPPPGAALAISVHEPAAPAPAGVRVLAGPEYAALRPEFWSVPEPVIAPEAGRILVTTGSSDAAASVSAVAAAVRGRVDAHLTAVVGPYSEAQDVPADTIVTAPDSLFDELIDSDVVICAAGQTMLEALACGRPCVAIPFVDNQRWQAEMLASRGAVVMAATVEEAAAAAERLVSDAEERRHLSHAGRAAIDGQGAMRVAAAVAELSRG
jgi:UDP:flavonoid glycosyltransferase YjiC (YdhE family)